jgi:hypothetical protein
MDPNEILSRDLGEWDAEITVLAGPAPSVSHGRMSARLVAGGRWLVMDYENPESGFGGHGVYGWDESAARFVGTWVDNMTGTLRIMHGTADADGVVSYEVEIPTPGGPMVNRQRTSAPSADVRRFTSAMVGPDGSEFPVMEAIYRRRSARGR